MKLPKTLPKFKYQKSVAKWIKQLDKESLAAHCVKVLEKEKENDTRTQAKKI